MGNLSCCEGVSDSSSFREYCEMAASENYKPYLVQLQNQEIHLTGETKSVNSCVVLGDWEQGASNTGRGIIFAPETFYYQGEIHEGVAKGTGRILWPNKVAYKGIVMDNKAEGEGQLLFNDGTLELKGCWSKGFPKLNHKFEMINQGRKGRITFVDVTQLDSEEKYFKDLKIQVQIQFQSGVTYEGDLKRKKNGFKIEGQGTMRYPDGSYYSGDFEGGRMHGKGKYFWASTGHWYEGEYKCNFRDGWGKYFYSEEDFEQGRWMGGTMVGQGKQEDSGIEKAYKSNPLNKIQAHGYNTGLQVQQQQ